MAEEEKGFVLKDRRSFDEKGDLKDEKAEESPKKEEAKDESRQEQAERQVTLVSQVDAYLVQCDE